MSKFLVPVSKKKICSCFFLTSQGNRREIIAVRFSTELSGKKKNSTFPPKFTVLRRAIMIKCKYAAFKYAALIREKTGTTHPMGKYVS